MSYNCIDYDCSGSIGTQTLNSCGEEIPGGLSGGILFECNSAIIDYSNASQINAEIAAGRAKIFKNIKASIPAPSPITTESKVAGARPKVSNYDRTLTLIDANVNINNVDVYNSVNAGKVFGSALFYLNGSKDTAQGAKAILINTQITFTGGLLIPDNDGDTLHFESTGAFRGKKVVTMVNAPVGIF